MAVLLTDPALTMAEHSMPHKTWTRDEVQVLESTGLFDGTHFELIDGELIDKMGKNRRHVNGTWKAVCALHDTFGKEFVNQEAPVDVSSADRPTNDPEPDVVLLRRPTHEFDTEPGPADVRVLLEVSDTTLRHDLSAKARLYARAGYAEYWVADVNGRKLHVLRDPADGEYKTRIVLGDTDSVCLAELPDRVIPVADLLP